MPRTHFNTYPDRIGCGRGDQSLRRKALHNLASAAQTAYTLGDFATYLKFHALMERLERTCNLLESGPDYFQDDTDPF